MASRVTINEEEIWGKDRVRKYAQEHKKWAGLMYRGVVKAAGELQATGRFLEMGAGPGFLAMMMAQEYPHINITAVDLSPDMAEVAGEFIAENGLKNRINYVVGDVSDRELMQRLGKFDFVYSTFSLHHWDAPEEAIKNLWGAVRDGGIMYIHDFKRLGFIGWLPIKDGLINSIRSALTRREIETILKKTGITDYRIKSPFPFLFQSVIARK